MFSGQCLNDSRSVPDQATLFALANPIMDNPVPNHLGVPLTVYTGRDRFTKIVVDAKVFNIFHNLILWFTVFLRIISSVSENVKWYPFLCCPLC